MSTTLKDKPVLQGRLVLLRPPTRDDASAMVDIMSDPDVGRLTGSVTSSADAGKALPLAMAQEWYESRGEQNDRLDLVVVDRSDDKVVGEVVLNEWDEVCRSANFRTLIGPQGRGRGLGTEATRLLLAHAFDALGLHRVSLEVFDFNPRARHVYEKVGFVHEGTRRDVLAFDGEWIDAHDMSILAPEWRQHRGHPDVSR